MAIDPRRRYPFGQMAPMMYGAGTLNNASPMFQGPAYYNQLFNRPLQDWSQFMPTNSPLAGGGGINYQLPWGYGTGGGSGWGGAFGGGGGFMGGGLMGGGYPGWGGGYPGWTQPGFPGYQPPAGYDPNSNWRGIPPMLPWQNPNIPWAIPTDPSLAPPAERIVEGDDARGIPWQDSFLAPLGYKLGWNYAGGAPGISSRWQDMGSAEDDMLDAEEMARAGIPDPRTRGLGLLAGQVFDDDPEDPVGRYYPSTPRLENWMDPQIGQPRYAPPATNPITGLLGGPGVDMTSGIRDYGPGVDMTGGFLGPQVDDFSNMPQVAPPSIEQQGMRMAAPLGTPSVAPAPVVQAMQAGPVAPVDNFAQVQAQALAEQQRANEFASAQQAQQAQAAAEAFRQSQAAEAFRRDEARLRNLQGRDEFDAREMAELEARVGAYRGDPVGRAIAIQERDERGRDDTSGERSAGMGGGRGGFAGPDRW